MIAATRYLCRPVGVGSSIVPPGAIPPCLRDPVGDGDPAACAQTGVGGRVVALAHLRRRNHHRVLYGMRDDPRPPISDVQQAAGVATDGSHPWDRFDAGGRPERLEAERVALLADPDVGGAVVLALIQPAQQVVARAADRERPCDGDSARRRKRKRSDRRGAQRADRDHERRRAVYPLQLVGDRQHRRDNRGHHQKRRDDQRAHRQECRRRPQRHHHRRAQHEQRRGERESPAHGGGDALPGVAGRSEDRVERPSGLEVGQRRGGGDAGADGAAEDRRENHPRLHVDPGPERKREREVSGRRLG